MKFFLFIIISVLSLFVSQVLCAGGVDGGGGSGVRCGEKLELLDLYEAAKMGLKVPHTPKNLKKSAELIANIAFKHFWNPDTTSETEYIETIKSEIILPIFNGTAVSFGGDLNFKVEFGGSIPLATDIGKVQLDKGCKLEQIAYFYDKEKKLKIDQKKWQELSWLDKSALIFHELTYFMYRSDDIDTVIHGNNVTSKPTRQFVGQLFSSKGIASRIEGLPLNEFVKCGTDDDGKNIHYLYAYDDKNKGLIMYFNLVHGYSSPYQLVAIFKGLKVSELAGNKAINKESILVLTHSPDPIELKIKIKKDNKSLPKIRVFDKAGNAIGSYSSLTCPWN